MKLRNQLLALFCLLSFAAFGVLYFRHWVVQKPFGIILFVGEGLSPSRLTATRIYAAGADGKLAMDNLPFLALLSNFSNDFAVPDAAAAATTLATGVKGNNRSIGLDPAGKPLTDLLDLARKSGRATGLVTNARLTDPTSAAFFAKCTNPEDRESIARQLVEGGKVDVALGGGGEAFVPEAKGGLRHDGRDLLLEARRNGCDMARSKAELEQIPGWRRPKLLGIFSEGEMAFANQVESGGQQPSLPDMVRRAVEFLQFDPRGYLLVVDAGLMRSAAQQNTADRTLAETVELDRALATARRYTGKNSLIVVAGDCAMGGLALNGHPFRKDSGVALLGLNSAGVPSFTWATGPNGANAYGPAKRIAADNSEATVTSKPNQSALSQEPAAVLAPAAVETAEDVLALGVGEGAEKLHGLMDNTAIFKVVAEAL